MRTALVTIAIGKAYEAIAKLTHPTLMAYASRMRAEFVSIGSHKFKAEGYFEKFQLYEMMDTYDRIVYMDTDIVVRDDCPSLFELVPPDKFGAYDEHAMANEVEKSIHKSVMDKAAKAYGEDKASIFYNTGVMVASRIHKKLFDPPDKTIPMEYWEQPLINLRLAKLGISTMDIGYRFNRMQYIDKVVGENRLQSYVIHYAGIQKADHLIREDLDRWADIKEPPPQR